MQGATIGQYRIGRKLGSGGMGAVYVGEHALIGRRAAVKVLLPHLSMHRTVVARFFNEARAMTSISDPGIVQMFDFGFHTDGSAYIVMELLEGETLERRRRRIKRLAVVDALRIVRQIAGSVAAAHDSGVVHRDLKPENIFLVRDAEALGGERPKVLDFGIAKLSGNTEGSPTLTGTMMGTPVYMSPEQCRGTGLVDARSDIYSLGCVLFHLVVGRPPFDRAGIGELISAHMNDAPVRPSDVAGDVPEGFDDLVLRCLAKAPEARFQTMLEVQAGCDALLVRLSSPGAPAPLSVPPVLPSGPRSAVHGERPPAPAASMPTTLSSAVGVTREPAPPRRTRRIGVWIGFGGTVLVAAAIALIVGTSGGAATVPTPASTAALPAVAAPALPSPATPTATAAAPTIPTPPPVAPEAAIAVDAGAEHVAPDGAAVTPVDTARRKPPTPPRPRSRSDEMYDDR